MKSLKISSLILALLPLFLLDAVFAATSTVSIELKAGETRTFPIQRPIWVESKKILKVQVTSSGLLVTGLASGVSDLKIGTRNYTISVLSPGQVRTYEKLKNFLKSSLSLSVQNNKDEITVQGELLRLDDWRSLGEYCESQSCQYVFDARMSGGLQNSIRNFIKSELAARNLPEVSVSAQSPWILMAPKDLQNNSRLQKFADSFGLKLEHEKNLIESKKMIRIRLVMAEVSRKKFNQLGLEWPGEVPLWQMQKGWIADESVLVKLRALEEDGEATTLASPEIVGLSGEETEFFAGGEFPIRIINDQSKTVQWKKYGVILKFKPTADSSGRMRLQISTEISSLDKVSVDGVPGLLTHRIDSHFELLKSQTVFLSGLIRNDKSQNHMGLPGLKNLPIIGSLFSSQNFTESRSELVVLVKPEVIETAY